MQNNVNRLSQNISNAVLSVTVLGVALLGRSLALYTPPSYSNAQQKLMAGPLLLADARFAMISPRTAARQKLQESLKRLEENGRAFDEFSTDDSIWDLVDTATTLQENTGGVQTGPTVAKVEPEISSDMCPETHISNQKPSNTVVSVEPLNAQPEKKEAEPSDLHTSPGRPEAYLAKAPIKPILA